MKKPLLLLVDDDRAVLEALEAELAPEFAQLCRIEAFDDPHAALEALPAWAAERRSISVAIVDQKMPSMSGVEFLTALRSSVAEAAAETFAPARHMRAVMLTGYAGLDSALAAKNEGGVGRYVEKPWAADALRHLIRRELAAYAESSGADAHYVFREIRDEPEAKAALALRYEVYARTKGAVNLLPGVADGLHDVDSFDRYARLFGLFDVSSNTVDVVGTIRLVGDSPSPLASSLEAAFPSTTELGQRLRERRSEPLPMLKYLVARDSVSRLREHLLAAGEDVVEPGRLALLPGHREGGAHGARSLARHMIDGLVGHGFFLFRIMNAILTCIPPHDAFYKPYGFVLAEGTHIEFTPEIGAPVACLHGRMDRVPEEARVRCEEVVQRLVWNAGEACRCENFPACLGGPYASGDFSTTDLWCPALARRMLRQRPDVSGRELCA